jgi:hypothetical protein
VMNTFREQEPVKNFEKVQRTEWISPAFIKRIVIDELNYGKRIKAADFMIRGVAYEKHKVNDLDEFRNEEYIFGDQNNTPALYI